REPTATAPPSGLRPTGAKALAWLLSTKGSLKERTIRGWIWSFVGRGAAKVIGTAKVVILARLLAPEDFGLVGVAMFALMCLEVRTETGFNVALIHKQENIGPYLDVAWTMQLLRAIAIAVACLLGAPLVGWFFDYSAAVPIVQAIGLFMLARSLANPATV